MTTLLERAAALLRDLDGREGDETWEQRRVSFLQEYTAKERGRLRTLPAVQWLAVQAQEVGLSWVEVLVYRYRFQTATVEGWGNCVLYYDTDARCFYRKLQDGHLGYGTLQWQKGIYQQ